MKHLISVSKLNKVFQMSAKHSVHVLKNVDLTIKQGEFLVIMGASGSGKSTLLYNVSGMDKISSGNIDFEGKALPSMKDQDLSNLRLHHMGFIFQDSHLLKDLTIEENIKLPAYQAKVLKKNSLQDRVDKLAEKLGITSIMDHHIYEVSGGQLQRAAIARALINRPAILFGDEPTGALNSKAALEVMDILTTINREGTTVMLVTHDPKVAAIADRVLFMKDGIVKHSLEFPKYDGSQFEERQKKMHEWLLGFGF